MMAKEGDLLVLKVLGVTLLAGVLLFGFLALLTTRERTDQIGRQRQAEYDRTYRVGMACPCRCSCRACLCVDQIVEVSP